MTNISPAPPQPCPACGGVEFERGFIDDVAQGRIRWLAGAFERGFLGNARGRTRRPQAVVTAYRCMGCSRLELYASPVQ